MDKPNSSSTGLARTKSEQLAEAMAGMKPPTPPPETSAAFAAASASALSESSGGSLSRKSSRRTLSAASPGRSFRVGGEKKSSSTHIRKARSAQLKLLDVDDVSSGAALSRASSASLGLSFSLTGFIMPPDDIADSKPFSDDDLPEDLEAGNRRKRINGEPTLPVYLKFTDVTYKVNIASEEKEILHGITGSVDPGEVLAMMGPSGSGKTTLLNLLGGRLTSGGSITYNDHPYSKLLKSRIGFVTQDDVLFPHLTVRETLTYSAFLRLPKKLTREEKESRALEVICELGLERSPLSLN